MYWRISNIRIESNELKKNRIKNRICYYFDDRIKFENFDIDIILIEQKLNILIYDISCKTLIDPKPLRIKFSKIDWFIRIYDGTGYLTLFSTEKYDTI